MSQNDLVLSHSGRFCGNEHDSHGLNVKSITHLYLESRSLTLSKIRFFSDGQVRHALDSKEQREDGWRRKFSSAIYAKGLIEEVVTPVTNVENTLTASAGLDSSQSSWSSLELDGLLSPQPSSPILSHQPSSPILFSQPSSTILFSQPSSPILFSQPSSPILSP